MKKNPQHLLAVPEPTYDAFFQDQMQGWFDGLRMSYTFITALGLKIFDMTRAPITGADLAKALGADEDITTMLCRSLAYMGLLHFEDGKFTNAPVTELYFVSESPFSQNMSLSQTIKRTLRWQELVRILETGATLITPAEMFTKDWINAIGQSAMAGHIGAVLKAVENHVDLSRSRTLLDLGGGHALYAIGFCHAYPNLEGTVFDQPSIIGAARENISDYGSNVKTVMGNFVTDEIPGSFDIIFTSFNKTGLDPTLVPKVVKALNPGGYLIVHRHLSGADEDPLRLLEWNFTRRVDFPKGDGVLGGIRYDPRKYVQAVKAKGLRQVSRDRTGTASELLIFRAPEASY